MEYEVIRSKRCSTSIEIEQGGKVIVRCNFSYPKYLIEKLLAEKQSWIRKNIEKMEKRLPVPELSPLEIEKQRGEAKAYIIPRLKELADRFGFSYAGVRITKARHRFGSCSAKNSLCFSLYLMQYPREAADYVIVHELCHTREHNHSPRFYALVRSCMPDYEQRKKLLIQ